MGTAFLALHLAGDIKSCRAILADLLEHLILGQVRMQSMQMGSAGAPHRLTGVLHRQLDQGRIKR